MAKIDFRLSREDEDAFAQGFAEMLSRILALDDTDAAVHILRALTDPGLLTVTMAKEEH